MEVKSYKTVKFQFIYEVHYLFPREDRTYRPFALNYFADGLYESRVQEFIDKHDAIEFLDLTRLHFQKILPYCASALSKKNFYIRRKIQFSLKFQA